MPAVDDVEREPTLGLNLGEADDNANADAGAISNDTPAEAGDGRGGEEGGEESDDGETYSPKRQRLQNGSARRMTPPRGQ